MSLTIEFYTNESDRRVASKSLTSIASKTCELKGDCDIVRPVIIVTGDAATYASCNYMYISAFNRYYFASVRSLPGGLLEISGECDILSSAWAAGLGDLSAVIDRQENAWNLYLNDGTFQAYANDQVVTKEFSDGFTNPCYVMVCAG